MNPIQIGKMIEGIRDRRPDWPHIRVAVETGTFEASTSRVLQSHFSRVHTIELAVEEWQRNDIENEGSAIQFHFGDSAELVPTLAMLYEQEPVFWFLGARFTPGLRGSRKLPLAGKGHLPLWHELDSIRRRKHLDIVVIDDVHAFGRQGHYMQEVRQDTINSALTGRIDSAVIGDAYVVWVKPERTQDG